MSWRDSNSRTIEWGDRKIKRPFPPPASAHPMPPCPLMPAPGVGPHAPRQRLASAGCRRQAAGSHRSARTARVAGDGQPAQLELLGGRLLGGKRETWLKTQENARHDEETQQAR